MGESHQTARLDDPSGAVKIGPYRPVRLLGEGGMGEVYLAEGPAGEQVALKVLAQMPAHPDFATRLEREGRVLDGIEHPHIVRVVNRGFDTEGRPFVALEYVQGRSLSELLFERLERRLDLEEAALILDSCADALSAMHARGILHRDLKPANILISYDGTVKLIDFGLALTDDVSRRLTRERDLVGTPAYLPPEVVNGEEDWSASSDLYAFGCLAFHLISGTPPFSGDMKQVLQGKIRRTPPPLDSLVPGIPLPLAALVAEFLDRDPEMRPTLAQAREVLGDISPGGNTSFWLLSGEGEFDSYGEPVGKSAALVPGATFDRYRLGPELGRGGMGVVYRAEDSQLKRTVALKLMIAGEFASPDARRRFLREAESVAALDHPNIVRVFDIGEHRTIPFLSMELVEGSSLDEVCRGERDLGELLRTFLRICEGVQHAHMRGVIHRDLKPQNVLVGEDLAPRVLDFGLAKRVTEGLADHNLTKDGSIFGTLRYMPPEQALGEIEKIDVRSDVYSLGVILYELVTRGRAPYEGPQIQVAYDLAHSDPPPPSSRGNPVPWELDAICLKAIEKDQDRRYQSVLALKRDVERYLTGLPIRARKASLLYRLKKGAQRHRTAVAIVSILVLAAAGALLALVLAGRAREREIVRLLEKARAAPLAERPQRFSEILGIDPENPIASVEREAAERELSRRREAAEEKERDLRRLAEEELRTEKAQAKLRAAEAKELAQREAEAEERRKAGVRAREALARAESAEQAFEEISALREGLVVLPPGSGELRDTLEARMVEAAQRLTETALARGEAGLARFWLREAGLVDAAKARAEELEVLTRRVERLESGQGSREEALEFMRRGEWLAARDKLEQAREKGVPPEVVEEDLSVVRSRCREVATALLAESRGHLGAGRLALALQKSQEVENLWAESEEEHRAARDLLGAAAERIETDAQVESLPLFLAPGSAEQGLATLEAAVRMISGTPAGERLERELRHRRLQERNGALRDLVYVPAFARLENGPFFISRGEVTNAEYLTFVDGGGYGDPTLFDEAARPHLGSFLDGTPGSDRSPGPRGWQYGSYGDPANADHPVRGITWYEARAFARWMTRRTGDRWRLPTVREWEVAAGWAPAEQRFRRYPFGDEFEAGGIPWGSAETRPPGSTSTDRSALGIFDAGGNLSEWVETSDASPRPALKGASFAVPPRVASHQALVLTTGDPDAMPPAALTRRIGFRLVLEPPEREGEGDNR